MMAFQWLHKNICETPASKEGVNLTYNRVYMDRLQARVFNGYTQFQHSKICVKNGTKQLRVRHPNNIQTTSKQQHTIPKYKETNQ